MSVVEKQSEPRNRGNVPIAAVARQQGEPVPIALVLLGIQNILTQPSKKGPRDGSPRASPPTSPNEASLITQQAIQALAVLRDKIHALNGAMHLIMVPNASRALQFESGILPTLQVTLQRVLHLDEVHSDPNARFSDETTEAEVSKWLCASFVYSPYWLVIRCQSTTDSDKNLEKQAWEIEAAMTLRQRHVVAVDPKQGLVPTDSLVAVRCIEEQLERAILVPGASYRGRVKRYNPTKGFGFIASDVGPDIFVHQSNVTMGGFRGLNIGSEVSFVVGASKAHLGQAEATHVVQASQYKPTLTDLRRRRHFEPTSTEKMLAMQYAQQIVAMLPFSADPRGGAWRSPDNTVFYAQPTAPQLTQAVALVGPSPPSYPVVPTSTFAMTPTIE